MAKYHIGANGPSICKANIKDCPIGGEHFVSRAEANNIFQERLHLEAKEKECQSKNITNNLLRKEYPLIKEENLPKDMKELDEKFEKYHYSKTHLYEFWSKNINNKDFQRIQKRVEKNYAVLEKNLCERITENVEKNGPMEVQPRDLYSDDLSVAWSKFGKVKEVNCEKDRIDFNNGKQNISYTTTGDCCSTSEVEIDNPEKLKNHAIKKIEIDEKTSEAESTDPEVQKIFYKIHLDDGSTLNMIDTNYSNGYYSSIISWGVK